MKYLSIIYFTILLFACYGWGYALVRWTAVRDEFDFAFLAVVGIACMIFIGGVLNLVRLAYPASLTVLLLIGLAFLAISYAPKAKTWISAWNDGNLSIPDRLKSMSAYALPVGILAIAVGFYALNLLPSAVFNSGDDFYTYLPRPIRMLQTGTISGDPFEMLGIDLGAQAFLHGFVLIVFPIEYLIGLDAVFGFALAGLLLIAIGRKFDLDWGFVAIALIVFIVVNPQTVNISALYTGSAIILGILLASCHLLDQIEDSGSNVGPLISVGISGLLSAGAIAVKTSFASYVFAYFAFFFTGLFLISKDKRKILKICGLIILSTFLAILPWLTLHSTNIAIDILTALNRSNVVANDHISLPLRHIPALFSADVLQYGDSYMSYGIIVLMLFMVGSYSLFSMFASRVTLFQRGYFLVASASCAAGIVSYFFNAYYTLPKSAVRYTCPILIAALPFALLVASMSATKPANHEKLLRLPGINIAVMMFMPLLVVILFFNSFVTRLERAYYQHMTLSYPVPDNYISLVHQTTSSETKKEIREIQYMAQPAQKILAWIDMPADLDFSRNEIYVVNHQGLQNPWLGMPFNGNINDMVQYLKGHDIRYIMWEYGDNYDRVNTYRRWSAINLKAGTHALYLRHMLDLIMKDGSFLYHANGLVLFDLQQIK